jgi:hypothetical protein
LGADLEATDLQGANLREADLQTADPQGADLSGTDLSTAIGLIQDQLDAAIGDRGTEIPQVAADGSKLTRPRALVEVTHEAGQRTR